MDGFSIASSMTWDMSYENFDDFPIMQKWFALGEAIAHIRFLENGGFVSRKTADGRYLYDAVNSQ